MSKIRNWSTGWVSFPAVILILVLVNECVSLLPQREMLPNSIAEEQGPATGPLRVHPSNPRYFTDGSGKAVYLTGSHTWANLQDAGYSDPPPVFDYEAYLVFLHANHHNFFRLWAWEQTKWAPWTTEDMWFSPSVFQRMGPRTALDGGPRFDLTKFDPAYFDRLRDRIIQAGDKGIYVSVMLFDGFSIDNKNSSPGNAWPGHPFNSQNNINGIDGDANHNGMGEEIHTLQLSQITSLQEAYVRKVIDTVNDLDNVLYEISNESPSSSQDWQYHMIEYIKQYEATLPKQHPVGMTVEYPNGNNAELFASPADWISPNDYSDPPGSDGSKVIIADTDHIWGIGGDRQWVWKSFTRGINPIFMDCYDRYYCEGQDPNDPTWESLRLNMGYTLLYANRIDLAAMTPRIDLCSSGYCLAKATEMGGEYLVYLPDGGSTTVDLTASPGKLTVEWFNPGNGMSTNGEPANGGSILSFSAPFQGDAVLYIYHPGSASQTPTQHTTPLSITPTSALQTATSANATPPMTPTVPVGSTTLPCISGILILAGISMMTSRLCSSW